MRSILAIVTCLAFLFLGAACATPPAATAPPARTDQGVFVPGKALAIAKNAAVVRGARLESYQIPQSAELLIRNRRLCWAVVFSPKEKTDAGAPAGGPFTVFVDDQTGATEFSGGK